MLAKGDLKTLGGWLEAGIVYVRGRFSPHSMVRIVGTDRLPVVKGSSRLAYLLAWEAHLEDHNLDTNILLARMRRKAWIIRARYPAKAVAQACMLCRRKTAKVAKQLMGTLPEFSL